MYLYRSTTIFDRESSDEILQTIVPVFRTFHLEYEELRAIWESTVTFKVDSTLVNSRRYCVGKRTKHTLADNASARIYIYFFFMSTNCPFLRRFFPILFQTTNGNDKTSSANRFTRTFYTTRTFCERGDGGL